MAHAIAHLLPYLRRLTVPPDADAVLLERFVRAREEAAFAALVARHGPMVVHVCERVLGDADYADAGNTIVQLDAEFAVKSERIREFQLQTCPLDWAEFPNVHLFRRTAAAAP